MYICICNSVTESDLASLLASLNFEMEGLAERLGFDRHDCCGHCAEQIDNLVNAAAPFASGLV